MLSLRWLTYMTCTLTWNVVRHHVGRVHAHACISQRQQCYSAAGAIELITHRVRRTVTLYSLSPAKIDRKHQLWLVSCVPYNQKQMSRLVSSYLVRTSNQQRCAHSRISLRQQCDNAAGAIELITRDSTSAEP